jgi:hypothetical protein
VDYGQAFAGGQMQSDDTIQRQGNGRLTWVVSLAIALTGVALVPLRAADVSGTIATAEPPSKRDGTLAHPYADTNQCPPSTDIVIWPEEWRSIPNIPRVFSVCFVDGQPKNHSRLEVR